MIRAIKQLWISLVVAVVIVVAGFGVYKLHGIWDPPEKVGESYVSGEAAFNPKHVIYEVFGPSGAVATINYLDADGQPHQVAATTLPWSYTITTTLSVVFANLVAQGDRDYIGCRITVDGAIKQEKSANGQNAQTYCLVKSA